MLAIAPQGQETAFPATSLAWGFGVCAVVMAILWVRQLKTRNATSVDVAWAALIALISAFYALTGDGAALQRVLAGAIALVWGGRLAMHLFRDRVLQDKGEDGRYRALRERLGDGAERQFAWVYLLQAALAIAFCAPFLVWAQLDSDALSAVQIAGLALVVLGLSGESVADRQLAAHRADPANKGKTCRRGLWRYSRHPNYFCEWLTWCGIGLLGSPAPHGWLALIAPVIMFVLVRYVSGVPFAEIQSVKSRGDDYRRYQATTNAFFPWFPVDRGATS